MLLSQFQTTYAVMPWLNKPLSALSSSQALHCDYEYTICRGMETTSHNPLKHFPNPNQQRRKVARVGFSEHIDVHEIPRTAETSSIWWSREDYSRMLLNTKLARSKMADNRQLVNDRSTEVCRLGLEGCSGYEYQSRKYRRNRVTNVVLKAQENQKVEGIKDPVYIAEISRCFTSASAEEAYLRANDGAVIEMPGIDDNISDQDLVDIRI